MKNIIQSIFLIVSALFFSNAILAQAQIVGTITDISGEVLPYANVLLLNAKDSAFVKGCLAKDDGSYAIPI